MSRFKPGRIIRIIKECGQEIYLISTVAGAPKDPRLGIASQAAQTEKRLTAYVTTPEGADNSMISVAGGSSRIGEYTCYVSAHDTIAEEFVPGAQIRHGGALYNLNYNQSHLSQGRVVLHELVISPTR
jgi:hypothetical protein